MKLSKEDLIAMLKSQVNDLMKGDEFSGIVKDAVSKMVTDLQNDVNSPFSKNQQNQLVKMSSVSHISDGMMYTKQGSIINLKNKNNPWISLSDSMQEWVADFAKYLKTQTVSKLLSEGVDSDGGFLVPDEFRALMIMYDTEETLVWSRATVWPMNGEKLAFPKLMQNPDAESAEFDHFAGVSFEWTEEGGEKQETQPEFGLVEMIVHELAGYTEITNTLLDDSVITLINYITRIFRAAWYWRTDKEFIVGTGGKKPLGITNDPNTLMVNRQTASNIEVQDVLNMEARLPSVFDATSVWFITKAGRASLRGQTVSASSKELVLFESHRDIAQGYQMSILGRPAVLADGKIPSVGNTGDLILGSWPWYYIGFRQDWALDSSRHYRFRHNRTALRCSGRVDGQASIPQAFVILTDPS